MDLFFSKLLPLFAYPLGAALLLGLAALVLSFARLKAFRSLLLAVALLGLWIASTPLFANWFVAQLEAVHPPLHVDQVAEADAIILLGGIVDQPLPPRVAPELGDSIDRVWVAAQLFRAGKAPVIIVSGGNLPWRAAAAPEAELIAALLTELGVSRSALVLETESRNTRENALHAAEIFAERGWRSGLLVTSGAHMRRALATFRAVGIQVEPVPADIRARHPFYQSALDVLPEAEALALTTGGVKELIGYWVYRYRGWL